MQKGRVGQLEAWQYVFQLHVLCMVLQLIWGIEQAEVHQRQHSMNLSSSPPADYGFKSLPGDRSDKVTIDSHPRCFCWITPGSKYRRGPSLLEGEARYPPSRQPSDKAACAPTCQPRGWWMGRRVWGGWVAERPPWCKGLVTVTSGAARPSVFFVVPKIACIVYSL